ncbi:MAG: sulfatase-like hydrolase/transferase [bacterium]|nr:sulfatase-like hydrolase/transferase [bacterium]MCP5065174.1 sulfatase-like hydrolase/transferase [bacterium]
MRERVYVALLSLAVAAGCGLVRVEPVPDPSAPSVLLVTIDTLRADHVGAYGASFARTPRLDSLADRGVRFERAMATAPLTLPSHASILTGLYPPSHGVRHNGVFRLRSEHTTMAERFRDAGWKTGAIIGAAVLNGQFGTSQGFDHYDGDIYGERATAAGFAERPADQVTDLALDWVRTAEGPFFLWVHYYDAHATYTPPEPFRSEFAKRPYDGEVAFVDFELGRLLDGIETDGKLENTMVAVTSDHGEGLGEHGEASHTYFIYDSDIHVPLILAGPGVPKGVVVDQVVSNAAVAPTVVALADLPALSDADVADLSQLWQGGSGPGWAYSESLAGQLDHGWGQLRAVRSSTHHFISAPRSELFDQLTDPHQQQNLLDVGKFEDVTGQARKRIADASSREGGLAIDDIDAETRAQIEALGYVVPGPAVEQTGADPKDAVRFAGYGFKALGLFFEEKYDEARSVAETGLEYVPNSAMLNDVLARVHFHQNDLTEARRYAERAVELNPHSAEFHAHAAFLRLVTQDLEGALEAFSAALAVDPNHVGGHLGMMWRIKLGAPLEEAARHAEQALEEGAGRPGVFETAGETWETLGEYERALDAYEQGVAKHPDSERLQMRLAIQYARFGKKARSEEHLLRAGSEAEDVKLKCHLGVVYGAGGNHVRAESIFREVIADHPGAIRPTVFLAHLLRTTGRDEEAEQLDVQPLPLEELPGGEVQLAPARG